MTREDRPWLAFYGPDVRVEIEKAAYRTLPDMIHAVAETYGAAPAFTTCLANGMNGTLSFAQTDEMSDAFAVYLREVAGLSPGDRVALQLPNCLSYPVAAFGVLKAGCVLVNVNPLYTAEEMAHLFSDAEPHALVIVDMFADKIPAATQGHPIPNIIVTRVAEFLPSLPRGIVGLVQRYWDQSVKPVDVPHIRLPDALASGRARRHEERIKVGAYHQHVFPEDVAMLQYTGGTTGVSKGAMLSHANLLVNIEQTTDFLGVMQKGKDIVLTALPLYHILAFTVCMLCVYTTGGRNILIPNPRPLSNLKRAFENYPITWMAGVNTLFNGLTNELWFRETPPKHLRFSGAGGMALQASVARRWEELTNSTILQGYGLTETSPLLTAEPIGKKRDGTIGIPIPSTEIACLDDAGRPAPTGTPGEIGARGPQVMKGYWNNPEETAKAMKNGWFLTGDIGVMDADGYIRIVDRKKDMVLVSGFNVYPNEIEECLAAHPGILESAVIGVPDDSTGEAVKAFVVKKDGGLTEAEIRAHCKAHLTAYKVPKRVEFRDSLPKSNVGKILRKNLRAEVLARHAAE